MGVSVLYELLFGCLPGLESRNLKMKAVLLLFAMIVVAFGQEADEGWEETPPADPPVEENKYKTDKYGNKPSGYKPKYGYQPPKPYGGYGYKKPVYGGYGNYGYKPTYGHDSYGYQKPTYGGYGDYGYKPSYGQESYGYQKPTYGGYQKHGYGNSYGHNSYGYQNPMYGGYLKHGYGNSYGYKKPYGTKYDSSHVDNTIKKVGEYADAQEDYKKQSLNIKYSYDAVPTEYDYVEKYGWGRPTTIGSLYNGYKRPSYRKKPYGYKSKYEKKPKEDQDWEEPKEETHEDGDWKDDTDEHWEE